MHTGKLLFAQLMEHLPPMALERCVRVDTPENPHWTRGASGQPGPSGSWSLLSQARD
jgi:hypothetical protein